MAGCCSCSLSPGSLASEMFTGNNNQERARGKNVQHPLRGKLKGVVMQPNNQNWNMQRKITDCLLQSESDIIAV